MSVALPKLNVDLVLCIDGTGSMAPFLEIVKQTALKLPEDIAWEARRMGKAIGCFRVKIIAFRDYLADGEHAIEMTEFLDLPEEKEDLQGLMSEITASGGGDKRADALEAIAYAMQSDWLSASQGRKRRQIIAVWTDASAHEIGFGKGSPYYDTNLPRNLEELTDWWGDDETEESRMDNGAKRLILLTPEVSPWTWLVENWNNVIHFPSEAGREMTEYNYSQLVRSLVRSF